MQKTFITFLLCFVLMQSFGQTERKVTTYLHGQFNKALYDKAVSSNPWGIGAGVQAFLNGASKWKPTMDVTVDTYLEDDKVMFVNPDGSPIDRVDGMVNVFAGTSYHPNDKYFLSLVAGPSFISGKTFIGIKPSFNFYFSPNQKWTGKIAYINIFDRHKWSKEDFGSISLSVGVKLF